jgi:DNA polymerase (family X)
VPIQKDSSPERIDTSEATDAPEAAVTSHATDVPDAGHTSRLSNGELGRIFHEIGDLLEVKGELRFKTVAYHRAADAIQRAPVDVASAYREGRPPAIPGVGKAIGDKIAEIVATGHMSYHERLRSEFPSTLIELLRVPGLGPRTVKLVYEGLGVATLDDLRHAAESGTLRTLPGLSQRAEESILAGISGLAERRERLLIDEADTLLAGLMETLSAVPGVNRIVAAGSSRRGKETVGDLDLLAETSDPAALVTLFTGLGSAEAILATGNHKAAIQLWGGPQVDLMIMPPGEAGTYLIHFTGSKEHNVRLRARARDRGWSLSEKGYLRIDAEGQPITGAEAELRTFATEEEAYAFLDLPFIEPELREDRGEIEAALAGRLPHLVRLEDLQGDLHSHSDWSDGTQPIEKMAEAARRRGHAYQVLTDHSVSLTIARGLDPSRVAAERQIVAELNRRYAAEEEAGTAPPETPAEGFRLLHGCEMEIRADGRLDYDDDLLAMFDVVVASLHVGRRQPKAQLMDRLLGAIRNPHVDVIAHPSGRKIGTRDDLDLDWDTVYAEAARTGTVLEINGSPDRLDLSAERARRAIEAGCIVSIDSDAHRISEFAFLRWGVSQARRGWASPADVLNTRSRADLLAWVADKGTGVAR